VDFNPEVQTSWEPLKPGGTNFKTHRLKLESPQRLVRHATSGALAFGGLFLAAGLLVGTLMLGEMAWMGLIFLLGFGGGGAYLLREFTRARTFDRSTGEYREGRSRVCALSEISGVQLLDEYVSGSESSYTSWEINLVLADSRRFNVTDHGDGESARADAALLARFLGVPLLTAPHQQAQPLAEPPSPMLLQTLDLMQEQKTARRTSSGGAWFMLIFGVVWLLFTAAFTTLWLRETLELGRRLDAPVLSGQDLSAAAPGAEVLTQATLSQSNPPVSGDLVLACREIYETNGEDASWEVSHRYLPEVSAVADGITFQLKVSTCPSGQTVEKPDATSSDVRVVGVPVDALVSIVATVTSQAPLTLSADRWWVGSVVDWRSSQESTLPMFALFVLIFASVGIFMVYKGWQRRRAVKVVLTD
jgi:hypothetical protein